MAQQRQEGFDLQVWRHALQFTAEMLLEGLARAGAKSRCTMMGRAAMSLDMQVHAIPRLTHLQCSCADECHIVDMDGEYCCYQRCAAVPCSVSCVSTADTAWLYL